MPKLIVILYLAVINLLAAVVAGYDKMSARKHRWRIPERTLFTLALLGGSAGMLAAMLLWRHKTRHPRFMAGIPAILLAQAVLLAWLWRYFV